MGKILLTAAIISVGIWSCKGQSNTSLTSSYQKGLGNITVEMSRLYVETLADDSFEGRSTGSGSAEAAADQIALWLEEMGVVPFGETYFNEIDTAQLPAPENPFPRVRNVIGMIEGQKTDEYVFIGAHYDHVGVSPKLQGDNIFNGADDNASGVAGVLQVAGAFAASGEKPERSVVFAFWDAEEIGLVGSTRFTQTFEGMDKIKAYFNLDMIGRDEGGANTALYFSTDQNVPYIQFSADDTKGFGFNVNIMANLDSIITSYRKFLGDVYKNADTGKVLFAMPTRNSDHAPFVENNIPIYMITTWMHPDYHQVTDHADKIAFEKLTEIGKFTYITMFRLANPDREIIYPENNN